MNTAVSTGLSTKDVQSNVMNQDIQKDVMNELETVRQVLTSVYKRYVKFTSEGMSHEEARGEIPDMHDCSEEEFTECLKAGELMSQIGVSLYKEGQLH